MKISDKEFCEELWNQYEPYLRAICSVKLNNYPNEIDDVISDTFLALCKKVSESGPPRNEKAWLYGTLNNIINAKYREIYNKKANIVSLTDAVCEVSSENDFEKEIITQNFTEQLEKEFDRKLNDEEKFLMKLIYQDCLKTKDITEILGLTEFAVKQRKYRLRKKMRKIADKIK